MHLKSLFLVIVLACGYAQAEINISDDTYNKAIKSLLVRDNILQPYEKDKVIISMAILEAKQSKRYKKEVLEMIELQKNENTKEAQIKNAQISTPMQDSELNLRLKSQQDELKTLQARIDKLTENFETVLESNKKQEQKIQEQELEKERLKHQIAYMKEQKHLETIKKVKEPHKILLQDIPRQKYDNNWSTIASQEQ